VSKEKKTTFDITFITPERYSFVCVGKKQSYEIFDDEVHSSWKVTKPLVNASFNIGRFTKYEIIDERVMPITIMMSEDWHKGMWVNAGSDMEEQVGEDVTKSLIFFEHMFGETDVEHFYVTEILQGHGVKAFYHIEIGEGEQQWIKQIGKGRLGENTQHETIVETLYTLSWRRNKEVLDREKNRWYLSHSLR